MIFGFVLAGCLLLVCIVDKPAASNSTQNSSNGLKRPRRTCLNACSQKDHSMWRTRHRSLPWRLNRLALGSNRFTFPFSAAGASATPAVQAASPAPTPTLEQRVAGLEAYLTNGDPTVSLKDKDGNIPKDLTTVSVGTS